MDVYAAKMLPRKSIELITYPFRFSLKTDCNVQGTRQTTEAKKRERAVQKETMEPSPTLRYLLHSLTLSTIIVFIANTHYVHCGASTGGTIPQKSNVTKTHLDQFSIADKDMELEFQMPSEITRRFLGDQSHPAQESSNPFKPVFGPNCGRPPTSPKPCHPKQNPKYSVDSKQKCAIYTRGQPCQIP